jgi:hypothetical protein
MLDINDDRVLGLEITEQIQHSLKKCFEAIVFEHCPTGDPNMEKKVIEPYFALQPKYYFVTGPVKKDYDRSNIFKSETNSFIVHEKKHDYDLTTALKLYQDKDLKTGEIDLKEERQERLRRINEEEIRRAIERDLEEENIILRRELEKIREECDILKKQNNELKETIRNLRK